MQYRELGDTDDADVLQCSRRLCCILLQRSLDVIRQWASAVPGFSDLNVHDQQLLFRSSVLELFTLKIADRLDLEIKLPR